MLIWREMRSSVSGYSPCCACKRACDCCCARRRNVWRLYSRLSGAGAFRMAALISIMSARSARFARIILNHPAKTFAMIKCGPGVNSGAWRVCDGNLAGRVARRRRWRGTTVVESRRRGGSGVEWRRWCSRGLACSPSDSCTAVIREATSIDAAAGGCARARNVVSRCRAMEKRLAFMATAVAVLTPVSAIDASLLRTVLPSPVGPCAKMDGTANAKGHECARRTDRVGFDLMLRWLQTQSRVSIGDSVIPERGSRNFVLTSLRRLYLQGQQKLCCCMLGIYFPNRTDRSDRTARETDVIRIAS